MTPIQKCHADFKLWIRENNHTGYKLMKMGYYKYAEIRRECIAYLISRGHSNVCIARVLGMHRNNVVPSKIKRKENHAQTTIQPD